VKKILFKKILFVFGLLLIFLLITTPALAEVDATNSGQTEILNMKYGARAIVFH